MKLYHFTDAYNLFNVEPNNILDAGLIPGVGSGKHLMPWVQDFTEVPIALPDVVWFTRNPQPVPPMFENGQTGERSNKEVRITVVIPSTSKRLMRWQRWLRTRLLKGNDICATLDAIVGPSWREWYVHFGCVPNGTFRAVDYADPERRRTGNSPVLDQLVAEGGVCATNRFRKGPDGQMHRVYVSTKWADV
jgi:hypothetical protein